MEWSLIGVILSAVYLVVAEVWFRKDWTWKKNESNDKGTTRLTVPYVVLSIFVPAMVGKLLAAEQSLPAGLAWLLVVSMVAGIALRYWSMQVLGAFFSRTLRVQEGQRLVSSGPYALIRHPGYAANALVFLPNALLGSGSVLFLLLWTALYWYIYALRIGAEEAMLTASLPDDYPAYCRRTKKLIPFVY